MSKKYDIFTPEQQKAYNGLSTEKQKYIDYRAQGYNKKTAYELAGFRGKNTAQASNVFERRNPEMCALLDVILNNQQYELFNSGEENKIDETINALAKQQDVENVLSTIDGSSGEKAKQIKFYRDIINGKIKTKKTTTQYDADGNIVSRKVEEISDVTAKMNARKELDRILGVNKVIDLGSLSYGDITVNIVNASKADELEDSRNNPTLVMEKDESTKEYKVEGKNEQK